MTEDKILKDCDYKSYDWASRPVVFESLFREYDLRNNIKPIQKGGKYLPASVNEDGFRVLGQAYGTYVQKKLNKKKIVVANDYRYYSRGLAYAFITGVLSTGVDVVDIGLQLTPVMYYAQYYFKLEAGAMVTASHNDNGWTGLKLAKGLSKTFEPDDILEFKDMVYSGKFLDGKGTYERVYGFKEKYIRQIIDRVKPFMGKKRLKVVISGTNGAGGDYLLKVFQGLGFEIVELYNDMDWDFPNFNPNPENIKFLEAIGEKVREVGADIGVGTDGDGDRFGAVDNDGKEIFADRSGLLLTRYFVELLKTTGQKVIIDVKSTNAYSLDLVLKKYGTEVIFCKTGHSYVKAATQKYDALAGFEKSGHFFLRDKFGFGYDDASLAAAWVSAVLTNSDKKLSVLLAEQPKSFQSPTMSPSVNDDKEKYVIVDKVIKHFKKLKDDGEQFAGLEIEGLITVNGVRIVFKGGAWGLIRASSNQPVLVLVAESFKSKREMYDIVEALQEHLSQYDIGEYDQVLPPFDG